MPMKDFKTLRSAEAFVRKLEKAGDYTGSVGRQEIQHSVGERKRVRYTVRYQGVRSNNSGAHRGTKAQRKERAKKLSAKRRVAVALAKYLRQANPGMKADAVRVQKLKGGVIKITPVKGIRRR